MANRSCTADDPDTVPVEVTSILREAVCCFDESDMVLVQTGRHGVRVAYISTRASREAGDVTRLGCRADSESSQMWVDDLRVADSLRSKGIGRQLVAAAERIALALGRQTVSVFPLVSAGDFWKKMGYTSHPKIARVATKDLAKDHAAGAAGHEKTRQ